MTETLFSDNIDKEKPKKEHKLLKPLLTILAVILFSGLTAGGVWYWQQNEMKKQRSDSDTKISDLRKEINDLKSQKTESTVVKDETSNWKTYTSTKYGFSFKYPDDWTIKEDYKSSTNTDYLSGNILSETNVLAVNEKGKYGIGFNINPLGRGGPCVRQSVAYSTQINEGKLILTKTNETYRLKVEDEKDMCSGIDLSGYSVSSGGIEKSGTHYSIISSSGAATDTVAKEAIDYFVKITETFKFLN